jgi:hypothetical protein
LVSSRVFKIAETWTRTVCFTLFVLAGTSGVAAAPPSKPVYFAANNSYFELVEFPKWFGLTWLEAKAQAEQRSYKGVQGRLAVITGENVNDFLRQTFAPARETWIGLRYWCPYLKLQWVTGDFLARTEYSNWHPYWFRDPASHCAVTEMPFMPVYYTPNDTGFLWQAAAAWKRASALFIEYPMDAR